MYKPRTVLLALGTLGAIAWMKRKPSVGSIGLAARAMAFEGTAGTPNAAARLPAAGLARVSGDVQLSSEPSPEALRPGFSDLSRGA